MTRKIAIFALPVVFLAGSLAAAQTQSGRRDVVAKAADVPVDIKATFALATASEHWSIEDPIPSAGVDFAGKKLPVDDRLVNKSVGSDGEDQWLFPVSWFDAYRDQNPEFKYVVVKYRDGRAVQLMAELQPGRSSLPKESFQAHPDGKSYYSDLAMARQDGYVYIKQAVSQGRDDGHGGLWVDMLVIYRVADPNPPKATTALAKRP